MKTVKQHKGQAAMVLVLIMTVVSALAVSLATRSTIDTKIQKTETEGVQALLYAQTGLEQLIMHPAPTSGAPDSNYHAVSSDTGKTSLELALVKKGSTIEINLAGSVNLAGFAVSWGPINAGDEPAVLISLINDLGVITDKAYDYGGLNGFTAAGGGSGGYAKTSGTVTVTGADTKVRITVLGSPAKLKVVPVGVDALFASQTKSIKSIGSVLSVDKNVKYGLQYDESIADTVLTVFDYALFSGGSINQ